MGLQDQLRFSFIKACREAKLRSLRSEGTDHKDLLTFRGQAVDILPAIGLEMLPEPAVPHCLQALAQVDSLPVEFRTESGSCSCRAALMVL